LKILSRHDRNFTAKEDLIKRSLHFDQICKLLPSFDRAFVLDNLDFLRTNSEVYCSMKFDDSVFCILSSGNNAFNDAKYLQQGIKERLDFVFDVSKTISTVVLLVIAVWTFFQNLQQTNKNKIAIEKLQTEVFELRSLSKSDVPKR
jgi:hypothetical protein